MAESVSNELLYEVLKNVQAGQARTVEMLEDLRQQVFRIREDINGLRGDGLRQERAIAALQVDMERLSARLGLIDPAH